MYFTVKPSLFCNDKQRLCKALLSFPAYTRHSDILFLLKSFLTISIPNLKLSLKTGVHPKHNNNIIFGIQISKRKILLDKNYSETDTPQLLTDFSREKEIW